MSELQKLANDYMKANPNAENPMDLIFLFSENEVIQLFKIAKNRLITFKVVDGVTDLTDVYINNKKINLNGTL